MNSKGNRKLKRRKLCVEDMREIARFHAFVKAYLRMKRIEEKSNDKVEK